VDSYNIPLISGVNPLISLLLMCMGDLMFKGLCCYPMPHPHPRSPHWSVSRPVNTLSQPPHCPVAHPCQPPLDLHWRPPLDQCHTLANLPLTCVGGLRITLADLPSTYIGDLAGLPSTSIGDLPSPLPTSPWPESATLTLVVFFLCNHL